MRCLWCEQICSLCDDSFCTDSQGNCQNALNFWNLFCFRML